ncbi:MAG: hypothetical protein CEE43_13230 [Promethearchaeota archaeon Loki_b32]|nr:MAG: hypothetical protein CEE43_13230 [Candidatus Lokiarchaeota archaeon Loki_b32]
MDPDFNYYDLEMGSPKEERRTFHRKFNGRLINRCYNELIQCAHQSNSRFAFHALGVIILEYGAKMPDEIKKLIIENSRWIDGRNRFKHKLAPTERKKYLFDFIAKLLEYKDGEIVKFPWVPEGN